MTNWRDDVKKALLQCGIDNKPTTFLFCDTQIVDEQMLEDINGILNSGDIPNLYKVEDIEEINNVGKKECISKGIQVSRMNMFTQYILRVKNNIHMVIAMSPLGEVFRTRIRMFPSLVNCCTLDWFTEWPEEALVEVAKGFLKENDLELEDKVLQTVEVFKIMHQTVEKTSKEFLEQLRRYNYVTPTSYLELLNLYHKLLTDKRKETLFLKTRLQKGLTVLADAAVEIDKLKDTLAKKSPILEKTKQEVNQTKEKLSKDKAEADAEKQVVAAEEADATQQEQTTNALKLEAEAELAQAEPLLRKIEVILKQLKPNDLVELASYQIPTATMVLGLQLACIFFDKTVDKNTKSMWKGEDKNGWFHAGKTQLLNDPKKFHKDLLGYDK